MAVQFLKKTSMAVACLGIGLLAGGCAKDGLFNMHALTSQDAKEYLNEKYECSFFLDGYEQNKYLATTDGIVFKSDQMIEGLEENAHLYIVNDKQGAHFADDYFLYVIRPELEDMVLSLFQTEFEDVKVRVRHNGCRIDDRLNKDSTMEDFFRLEKNYRLHPVVYLRQTPDMTNAGNRKKYERLMEQFRKKYNIWAFHICIIPGDVYDSADFDSWSALGAHSDEISESEFIMIRDDKIRFKSDRDDNEME